MPSDPTALLPLEIAVLQDDDGDYLVRVTLPPTSDGETPVVTLSGEAALLLGRSLQFAAYVAQKGITTTEAQA